MTDQKTDQRPCPFCGSGMENRNGILTHPEGVTREDACILSGWGFPVVHTHWGTNELDRWNRRADLAPKVKPLEWEKMDESAWIAHGIEQAEYHISTSDGSVWEFSLHYDPEEAPDFTGSEGEVKAHVEQVHERRILSALTHAPITPAQAAKVLEEHEQTFAEVFPSDDDGEFAFNIAMTALKALAGEG